MKYDAYAFMEFIRENGHRVGDAPIIQVEALVNRVRNRLDWRKWVFGVPATPMEGVEFPADDLPPLLFDMSLTHDMSGWHFDQEHDTIVGFTIYLIPTHENTTSITPEFIDTLHRMALKAEQHAAGKEAQR